MLYYKKALVSLRLLLPDVLVHLLLHDLERPRRPKHGVVEVPDVEVVIQLPLRSGPEISNSDLAHLVAQRLPRPSYVPVNLGEWKKPLRFFVSFLI